MDKYDTAFGRSIALGPDGETVSGDDGFSKEEFIMLELIKSHRIAKPTALSEEVMEGAYADLEAFFKWFE
jgi:hypothetical protein